MKCLIGRTARDLETGRMSDTGDVSLTDMTYKEFRDLHLEKGPKMSHDSGPLSFHTLIKKEHERNRVCDFPSLFAANGWEYVLISDMMIM
jgi:hypothetical protein